MKKLTTTIPFVYLIFVTFWLRLVNLGYSNYQGDEIKALYRPADGQNLIEFLFSQRKGPIQFLVTYLMRIFNPSYDNEFLMRLPFAIAGILAVFFFYKFVQLQFGQKIALYSSLFLSVNGLFVAFARIVQYQSFVILFSILTLYFLSLATKYNHWRIYGLYLGICFWGLSIYAHYDGIFIAPFVFYLICKWYINSNSLSNNKDFKHLVLAMFLLLLSLLIFYIPFFLSVSEDTKEYWAARISKQATSSSLIFMNYNTSVVFYIYILLGVLSLFRIRENFTVLLWLLFPMLSLETFVGNAGTHIFTYVLPFCILNSFGIEVIQGFIDKKIPSQSKFINIAFLNIIFVSTFLFSHILFVDNTREYPWESKRVLGWEFKRLTRKNIFGFPYYRHWEKIGMYLKTTGGNGYFFTNEKPSITRYYIPKEFKNLEEEVYDTKDSPEVIYLIYIQRPQSHRDKILDKEHSYWKQRYQPVKTFFNRGREVATIYRIPAQEIKN
jgi:hypothetical protein